MTNNNQKISVSANFLQIFYNCCVGTWQYEKGINAARVWKHVSGSPSCTPGPSSFAHRSAHAKQKMKSENTLSPRNQFSQSLRIYKTQQQWIDTFTVRGLILKSVAPGHHDHLACCHGQKTGPGKPKRRSGCGQWLEPNMLWWSDEVRQSHGLHSNGMQHMCRASITQILNWLDWQKTWIYLCNITCQTDWSSS